MKSKLVIAAFLSTIIAASLISVYNCRASLLPLMHRVYSGTGLRTTFESHPLKVHARMRITSS